MCHFCHATRPIYLAPILPLKCEQNRALFDELAQMKSELFLASFRALPKEENPLTIKW